MRDVQKVELVWRDASSGEVAGNPANDYVKAYFEQ